MASQPAAPPTGKAARHSLGPAQQALIAPTKQQVTTGPAQSPAPKRKRSATVQAGGGPPGLDYSRHAVPPGTANATGPVTQAISGLLENQRARQQAQHAVLEAFAKALDHQAALFTEPAQGAFARELAQRFIGLAQQFTDGGIISLTTTPRTLPTTPPTTPPKTPPAAPPAVPLAPAAQTWAAVVRGKGKGKGQGSAPKKAATPPAAPSTPGARSPQPDDRVLVRLRSDAPTWDLPLYTIRCMVQDALKLKAGDVIAAQAIPTGIALRPRNPEVRDRLLAEKSKLLDLLHATTVERLQKWVSYVLQGCPQRVAIGLGNWVVMNAQLVKDEVQTQAKQEPIDCRPSRHQTDGPEAT